MKKLFLLSMLGLFLMGCANQELTVDNELENTDSSGSSFMSVRIVSTGSTGTRASEAPEFQDGENYENYVGKVRFFFFYDDVDGTAAAIFKRDGGKVSYYDWDLTSDDNRDNEKNLDETVEKILEHTLQFRVDIGEKLPARVLAVLNPTTEIMKLTSPSLKDLQAVEEDYEDYDEINGKKRAPKSMNEISKSGYGGFVMSNSVYADEDNNLVNTTDCKNKFHESREAAEDDVLTIYVERVLARIDLSVSIAKGYKKIEPEDGSDPYYIYATGQKLPDDAISIDETAADNNDTVKDVDGDIYVRFLGWNVFDTPKSSRLIKEIDVTNWNEKNATLFGWGGTMAWNNSYLKRSYWAINPLGVEYRTGSYSDGANNEDFSNSNAWTIKHNPMPTPLDGKETDYFQENASPSDNHTTAPTTPSKVVIAAQLVNSNGVPQTLAKWGGKTYTVTGLKNEFAKSLNMWKRTYVAGDHGETTTTYTHIGVDDLTFEENESTYKLTVTLAETDGLWYEQSATDSKEFTLIENPEKMVTEQFGEGNVKIWTKGYAYFYFNIRHLGETKDNVGYYGVVRNHIYDAKVTSIEGIGVPVYNPEKVIIETAPTEEDCYLGAEVKILQWRVVRHNYDLNW